MAVTPVATGRLKAWNDKPVKAGAGHWRADAKRQRSSIPWAAQAGDAAGALPQLAAAGAREAAGLRERVRVVARGDPFRAADPVDAVQDVDDVIGLLPAFRPNRLVHHVPPLCKSLLRENDGGSAVHPRGSGAREMPAG